MKKVLVVTAMVLILCFPSVITPAERVFAANEMPKPVAWWTFDDAEKLGKDSSGNNNHLVAAGGPKAITGGKFSGAVYLDGSSAMTSQLGETGDFIDKIYSDTGMMTLMYWYKVTKDDIQTFDTTDYWPWRRIVSKGCDWETKYVGGFTSINNPDSITSPTVFYSNTYCDYDTGAGDPGKPNVNPVANQFTGDWTFIAFTMDSVNNTTSYYINGELVCAYTGQHVPPVILGKINFSNLHRAFAFGANYSKNNGADVFSQSYTGSIDQAGVFDTALTKEQILRYMNGLPGDEPELTPTPTPTPQKPAQKEGQEVVIKFNTVQLVTKQISSQNYVNIGMLDQSGKFRMWGPTAYMGITLKEEDRFDMGEYKYMKIKYCGKTEKNKSMLQFATVEKPDIAVNGLLTIERKNEVWDEQIFDMSQIKNWKGTASGFQFTLATSMANDNEVIFIEYIAFFKTEAEAKVFGGLTEEQKAGKDPVSRYFSEGYTNPHLGYPKAENGTAKKTPSMLTLLLLCVEGLLMTNMATAFITAAVTGKKAKRKANAVTEGGKEDESRE